MIRFAGIASLLLLTACDTARPLDQPRVEVIGPIFAAPVFDCRQRPLPPPASIAGGPNAASAGARYETRLGAWGQGCSNQLYAVGAQLRAAGQVIDPTPKGN